MPTGIRRLHREEARVIARALLDMAQADGQIDPREVRVVEQFLDDCASVGEAPEPLAPPTLATSTAGLRDAFLCACIMLAFADGDFTAEEAVVLRRYATELGVAPEHLEELVVLVQDEQALPPAPAPVPVLLE